MRSVALANQKGGVGKTTTALHLGHGLAMAGQRVALFDLDPQGNASLGLQGMQVSSLDQRDPFPQLRSIADRLWLLPSPGERSNPARADQVDLVGLQKTADALAAEVDWLIVDCPPRMDAWGWAGMALCREVLIPVQAEFFAMQGLSHMMETLNAVGREFSGHGQLLGVLVTMLDVHEPLSLEIVEDLGKNLGTALFDTVVFRDVSLVESASHGRTLFDYQPRAKGAWCYTELVREVLYGRTSSR